MILAFALFRGDKVLTTLEFCLVLLVAAIPVAMPTVLSVTMAVGARLLAKKEAIVTRLSAIEELAGVDVLCSDKTGTLTQNKLTLGDPFTVGGIAPDKVILWAALASRAEDKDTIDLAVIGGVKDDKELKSCQVLHFMPFDPVHKRTEATVKGADGRQFFVAKGAPQVILKMAINAGEVKDAVEKTILDFAGRGYRSLGVARADEQGKWKFVGMLPLFDPPREQAKATIASAVQMGVKIKMVTGDQIAIARETSKQLGLGTNILDASALGDLKKDATPEQAKAIEGADGFAQVFPEHKFHIIDVLQRCGHNPLVCLDEFRTMVKELHRAGIEVILDVVYNHTGEGDENGPTLCFRGLENSFYYILENDKARYANYTGAGNTLKANHSIVKRLILDSLRYWASEMHVDGFRFDLASIFSRNESGEPMLNPPIVWEIDSDPVLAGTKLIAEAWDSGGLYQVGSFGQDKWKEWNGQFRDDIRRFVKGDENTTLKLRERITGSPDLYQEYDRPAGQSINFVTCHDGFTLNDLVSFDGKHNEANRESNTDGTNANLSWNCGVEGATAKIAIERLRERQIRNLLALTLLSVGTPMLLMGDEVCRTQFGNNNAYCQNNETSWFDWSLCQTNTDVLRFVRQMIHLRLHFDEKEESERTTLEDYLSKSRIEWHGIEIGKPDWGSNSHCLALSLHNLTGTQVRYIAINAYWEPLEFVLPPVADGTKRGWFRLMDTSLPAPVDIVEGVKGTRVDGSSYQVNPRSIILLHCDQEKNGHAETSRPSKF